MSAAAIETTLQALVTYAWDKEVAWPQIKTWSENFTGAVAPSDAEEFHSLAALSRFVYFGKRLMREMLRSLYRDHFEAPLKQRIRRSLRGSRDSSQIDRIFARELQATRFIGLGNPSESGAHLLYYFRQINHLPKGLFVDFGTAFTETVPGKTYSSLRASDPSADRYVFFDDLVGSAQQSTSYLARRLSRLRQRYPTLDLSFVSLFATTAGLSTLNAEQYFAGKATTLFELDDSYRAFSDEQRYFSASLGAEFSLATFRAMAEHYGERLLPGHCLGYKDGQLLLGFTHNTPDNTLPIFWSEGLRSPWDPIFVRYDKVA